MTPVYFGFWAAGIVGGSVAFLVILHRRAALTPVTFIAGLLAVAGLIVGAKLQHRLELLPVVEAVRIPLDELFRPGMRIPLGLLVGGTVALVWSRGLTERWRDVGDALAVGALATIPFGRLGCLLNGCCMGTVCGRWALPLCLRVPPGSEAYEQQLRDHAISLAATASLPAHPLPLYFGAGAIGILIVCHRAYERNNTPGILLLTACVLGSAAKLVLETFRAVPPPSALMFSIPAATFLVSILVALGSCWRRVVGRRRRIVAHLTLAAISMGPVTHASATAQFGGMRIGQGVLSILEAYAKDPLRHRRDMRRLERGGTDQVPPVLLIAMADARLRSGQVRAADRLFQALLDRHPGEPFATWARLGLGWDALLTGDVPAARSRLLEVSSADVDSSGLAQLLVSLVDAGSEDAALERLDALAVSPAVSPAVRDVARLGSAYARYWSGDYARAAIAFDEAVELLMSVQLVDDARYGAAWARGRAGYRSEAETSLRDLASEGYRHGRRASAALVSLEKRALLRAGFEHYRRGPLRAPEQSLVDLLDQDGPALARVALRRVSDRAESTRDVDPAARYGGTGSPIVSLEEPTPRLALAAGRHRSVSDGGSKGWSTAARLLGAVVLLGVLLIGRRGVRRVR